MTIASLRSPRPHALPARTARLPTGLLAVLALGTCLQALMSAGFAVAIPAIRTEFGLSTETAWVVAALYIATGVGAPVTGRLADLIGPRRVFTLGLCLTILGAAIGAWAPNLTTLLISRVILGLGSSAQFPAALAILRALNTQRGAPLAAGLPTISGTVQLALALGPLAGGVATQLLGWRAVTALAIPLALAAAVAAYRLVPAIPPTRARSVSLARALDIPGMIMFAATMATALVLLLELHSPRWWLLGGVLTQLAVLLWWQARTSHPFLDLALLRSNRTLTAVYLRTAAVYLGLDLILYGLPIWLQQTRLFSPITAGALLLPLAGSAAAGIWLAGKALPRLGTRLVLVIAAAVQILAALALLATVTADSGDAVLVATVILLGLPVGLHNLAHQTRCMASAPPGTLGTSSGLLRAGQYVGSCAAAGVLVLLGAPAPAGMVALALVILLLAIALAVHSTRTAS